MSPFSTRIEKQLDKRVSSFLRESRLKKFNNDIKGDVSYNEFLANKMLIIAAIRAGIPYSLFNLIQLYTPFSDNDWADFLDISTKSLMRYKTASDHHFKSIHSEKIIEMAEVTKVGLDVFGDMDKLKLWLNTPSFALGKLKPIELLKDSYGKELVISELIRINHGILV
ncbi:MAG: antitoxin Xre/MbcA/ParS toxin-binding domain-containing protein [Bacteroidota bacterium]